MAHTIATERRARPNLDGGRPTDQAVLAFEAAFEAIRLVEDHEAALEHLFAGQEQIRRLSVRLEDYIRERIARIENVLKPELQATVNVLDATLTKGTLARRAEKGAVRRAMGAPR